MTSSLTSNDIVFNVCVNINIIEHGRLGRLWGGEGEQHLIITIDCFADCFAENKFYTAKLSEK